MKGTTLFLMSILCSSPAFAESLVPVDEASVPAATGVSRLRLGDFSVDVESGIGRKVLSRGWKDLAQQHSASTTVTVGWERAGNFGLAVDALASRARTAGEQYAVAGATSEVGVGIRYRTTGGPVKAVVGAGAAWMHAEIAHAMAAWKTINRTEDRAGVWGSFGIRYDLGRHGAFGVDARYSTDDPFRRNPTLSAGGVTIGANIGLRFGGQS